MRTYGRIVNPDGTKSWIEVQTDAAGNNDYVYITTLIQNVKLNLGESPFYANNGLPAKQSVLQQVAPDFYMFLIQQYFSPYFANLTIAKVNVASVGASAPIPTYRVNIVTNTGVPLALEIPA